MLFRLLFAGAAGDGGGRLTHVAPITDLPKLLAEFFGDDQKAENATRHILGGLDVALKAEPPTECPCRDENEYDADGTWAIWAASRAKHLPVRFCPFCGRANPRLAQPVD